MACAKARVMECSVCFQLMQVVQGYWPPEYGMMENGAEAMRHETGKPRVASLGALPGFLGCNIGSLSLPRVSEGF